MKSKKTARKRSKISKTIKQAARTDAVNAKPETVLILRTCDKDRRAHGGFQYPESGPISAPDWRKDNECGHGLHGWLWGEGDGSLGNWSKDATWLVLEVKKDDIVDLGGKVKFPGGNVVHCGDQKSATEYILANGAAGKSVIGAASTAGYNGQATAGDNGQATAGNYGQATAGHNGQATAGYNGQATAGYNGQATAGDNGQATAGDNGQATAGNYGQATAGDNGQATAGYNGQATAGYNGKATAGNYGQATAGYNGKATAGDNGQATAGDNGQATAGYNGQATAGNYGKATAGDNAIIQISWWDTAAARARIAVGYIGENGLKPNTKYRLNDNHEFIEDK